MVRQYEAEPTYPAREEPATPGSRVRWSGVITLLVGILYGWYAVATRAEPFDRRQSVLLAVCLIAVGLAELLPRRRVLLRRLLLAVATLVAIVAVAGWLMERF